MSCWTKDELEDMLESITDELLASLPEDVAGEMIFYHGQAGTTAYEFTKIVLAIKEAEIARLERVIQGLKQGFKVIETRRD